MCEFYMLYTAALTIGFAAQLTSPVGERVRANLALALRS